MEVWWSKSRVHAAANKACALNKHQCGHGQFLLPTYLSAGTETEVQLCVRLGWGSRSESGALFEAPLAVSRKMGAKMPALTQICPVFQLSGRFWVKPDPWE
eukprot:1158145-Pelagomonas_calceolata.AAC.7